MTPESNPNLHHNNRIPNLTGSYIFTLLGCVAVYDTPEKCPNEGFCRSTALFTNLSQTQCESPTLAHCDAPCPNGTTCTSQTGTILSNPNNPLTLPVCSSYSSFFAACPCSQRDTFPPLFSSVLASKVNLYGGDNFSSYHPITRITGKL